MSPITGQHSIPIAPVDGLSVRLTAGSAGRARNHWAGDFRKAVFGERIWADRNDIDIPAQFRLSKVPTVTTAFQVIGVVALSYGLIRLDVVAVVSGVLLVQLAKCWYLDRMVLLFEEMKGRSSVYTEWEY